MQACRQRERIAVAKRRWRRLKLVHLGFHAKKIERQRSRLAVCMIAHLVTSCAHHCGQREGDGEITHQRGRVGQIKTACDAIAAGVVEVMGQGGRHFQAAPQHDPRRRVQVFRRQHQRAAHRLANVKRHVHGLAGLIAALVAGQPDAARLYHVHPRAVDDERAPRCRTGGPCVQEDGRTLAHRPYVEAPLHALALPRANSHSLHPLLVAIAHRHVIGRWRPVHAAHLRRPRRLTEGFIRGSVESVGQVCLNAADDHVGQAGLIIQARQRRKDASQDVIRCKDSRADLRLRLGGHVSDPPDELVERLELQVYIALCAVVVHQRSQRGRAAHNTWRCSQAHQGSGKGWARQAGDDKRQQGILCAVTLQQP